MSEDPDYLADLGELATLKNAIGGYFHQDAGLDYDSFDDAWRACATEHGQAVPKFGRIWSAAGT
jgi:hypothetical protein